MTKVTTEQLRVAYCECGARLAGRGIEGLLEAASRHVTQYHRSTALGATAARRGPSRMGAQSRALGRRARLN